MATFFKTGFNVMDQLYHRCQGSPHSGVYIQGQGTAHRAQGCTTFLSVSTAWYARST